MRGWFQASAIMGPLAAAGRRGAPEQSWLSPRDARARPHRIMQTGTLIWGRVRQDRPHKQDDRGQQHGQCLSGSHDRSSPSRASGTASLTTGVGGYPQHWWSHGDYAGPVERLYGRACRSGRNALSACREEPHHDERPHRNQKARHRASRPINQIAGRGAEHRAEHEGLPQDVHSHSTEQAAFQWGVRVTSCGFTRGEAPRRTVTDYRGVAMASPSRGTVRT